MPISMASSPWSSAAPNFSLAVQLKSPWPNCLTISGPDYAADRAWYAERAMPLFTWSSLAGGFLTGRFTRDNLNTFDSYGDKLVVECYCTDDNFQRLDPGQGIGHRKGDVHRPGRHRLHYERPPQRLCVGCSAQ